MKNLKQQLINKWGTKNGMKMYRHIYRCAYHTRDIVQLDECGESYDTMVIIMSNGVCLGLTK